MAAAVDAERRHQSTPRGPSPLDGVGYAPGRGELDLFRFVESPADHLIADAVERALADGKESAEDTRALLRQEDLYSLLTYARRCALSALRGHSDVPVIAGVRALALVDLDRIDWRDAAVACGLLAYAGNRVGSNVRRVVADAAQLATPSVTQLLVRYSADPVGGLAVGGYREVHTSTGIGLASDYGHPYEPTIDLMARSERVVALLEADRYRVTDITTGSDIPRVWLPLSTPATEQACAALRACVSVSARPAGNAGGMLEQMLSVWIVEAATPDDAGVIASAAVPRAGSGIALMGLASTRCCALLVARSFVQGVRAVEDMQSVQRFRTPLLQVLSGD